MKQALLDTNVLISGLLTPQGTPGRIVDLLLEGELQPVFDDRIWLEYSQVLLRSCFGCKPEYVADFLDYLESFGQQINAPPVLYSLPDPKDQPFLETAAATNCPIVTGNVRHFPPEIAERVGVRVLQPAEFLQQFAI
jgi:putative PIN family toxin of toxin-antitoxin system